MPPTTPLDVRNRPPEARESSDDLRAAYSAAVQLIGYEGQLVWRATGIYMGFASILIAGAVFPSFVPTHDSHIIGGIGLVVAAGGFVATILWWSMIARSRKYYAYWIASARELEQHLDWRITTLQRGHEFAEGGRPRVKEEVHMFRSIERVKMTTNLHILYGAFTCIFVSLVALNVFRILAR